MAINYPDKLKASTQGFALADTRELAGHKQVADLTALYALHDAWLSPSTDNTNNDAIGQEWYVVSEGCKYTLTDWDERDNADGWTQKAESSNDTLFIKLQDLDTSADYVNQTKILNAFSVTSVAELAALATRIRDGEVDVKILFFKNEEFIYTCTPLEVKIVKEDDVNFNISFCIKSGALNSVTGSCGMDVGIMVMCQNGVLSFVMEPIDKSDDYYNKAEVDNLLSEQSSTWFIDTVGPGETIDTEWENDTTPPHEYVHAMFDVSSVDDFRDKLRDAKNNNTSFAMACSEDSEGVERYLYIKFVYAAIALDDVGDNFAVYLSSAKNEGISMQDINLMYYADTDKYELSYVEPETYLTNSHNTNPNAHSDIRMAIEDIRPKFFTHGVCYENATIELINKCTNIIQFDDDITTEVILMLPPESGDLLHADYFDVDFVTCEIEGDDISPTITIEGLMDGDSMIIETIPGQRYILRFSWNMIKLKWDYIPILFNDTI